MTFKEYYDSIRKFNHPLSAEEEQQLPLKYGDDKQAIANELVLHNVGLAYMYISKFHGWSDDDKIDALALGIRGLYKAAELFDFSIGVRFSSYAYNAVRTAISRGMKPSKVDMNTIHMDKPLESSEADEDITLENYISADVSPEYLTVKPQEHKINDFSSREMCNRIREYVNLTTKLSPRDKLVFNAYMSNEMLNLQDIGNRYGMTRERVRQQEAKCLSIIRAFLRDKYNITKRSQLEIA